MPAIFISYASRDQATASRIVHALEMRGLKCWMSSRDIPFGQDYQAHIVSAIEAARVMLVLLSSHASASKEVPKETALASEINRVMIPVRIDASEVTGALRYQATNAQRLDLSSDFDGRIDELARQLAGVLDTAESTERRLQRLAVRRRVVAVLVWPVAIAVLAAVAFEAWHFAPHPQWLREAGAKAGMLRTWRSEPPARPVPVEATAPPAPVGAKPGPDERVTAFLGRYYAAMSGSSAALADALGGMMADPVQFYGRPRARHALIADEVAYAQRWPDRSFVVRADSVRTTCNSVSCSVTGVVDYTMRNALHRVTCVDRFDMRLSVASWPRLMSISASSIERHQQDP